MDMYNYLLNESSALLLKLKDNLGRIRMEIEYHKCINKDLFELSGLFITAYQQQIAIPDNHIRLKNFKDYAHLFLLKSEIIRDNLRVEEKSLLKFQIGLQNIRSNSNEASHLLKSIMDQIDCELNALKQDQQYLLSENSLNLENFKKLADE